MRSNPTMKDPCILRKQLDQAHVAIHQLMMGEDNVSLILDENVEKTFSKFNRKDLERYIANLEYQVSLSERSYHLHSMRGRY